MFNFYRDKIIVVTGAASGMGASYAKQLAAAGARLALCDWHADKLAELAKTLNMAPEDIYIEAFDVSQPNAMHAFAQACMAHFGAVDMVINNAGIEGSTRPVWATSVEDYQRVLGVNFFGVVNGTQAFLPYLVSRPWAALVNISSIFGIIGTPSNSDYCASKFAVRGFTEALMAELAEVHPQVQVHLVHPGGIATAITRSANSQAFAKALLTTPADDIVRHVLSAVLANRKRIVYGNQAQKTYWGAKLLPLHTLVKVIGRQFRRFKNPQDYCADHPSFTSRTPL